MIGVSHKSTLTRLLETDRSNDFLRYGVVSGKVSEYKSKGREIQPYGRGRFAVKVVSKSPKGKVVIRFIDVSSGRFIKNSLVK